MPAGCCARRVVRAQDLGDLGTRELARQAAAGAQDLAHLRARQLEARLAAVGAGARRGERVARQAIERRLEAQRRHADLLGREAVEDLLRVVGSVVGADAGMVAADDQVRDAVVLARERVEECLARPGVAHRRGEAASRARSGLACRRRLRRRTARSPARHRAWSRRRGWSTGPSVARARPGQVLLGAVDRFLVWTRPPGPSPARRSARGAPRRAAETGERQVGRQPEHPHRVHPERPRPRQQVSDTWVGRVLRAVDFA